jgi:type I restriction enzyme M protein
MNHKVHNQLVNFIWSIADDVLRDVFVRGKYRDIILPFTVLRRLDVLLVPSKEKVLEAYGFIQEQGIDDKSGLTAVSGYPFYNTSNFTFDTLLNDPGHIDSNLEVYLDGFSDNVQEIISKFKLRHQLETIQEAGITYDLIEKYTSKDLNLGPEKAVSADGEVLPPLTNLGMGYVFEELIRKFNEDNNEEAGEHFTPREIIKLMTHIIFEPVKDQLKSGGTYLVYDPACGSGGMLTEAEAFAGTITGGKSNFFLFGQEVNPETFAICTSDMLIKAKAPENIVYGSTLSKDGFPDKQFDFMLSNPPYGKSWKIDYDSIVGDRKKIKDLRFIKGVPRSSDGQLLFLSNMAAKMKTSSKLGSRIASVHNGSALFTGDAGGGESEIRRWLIENDLLDCIIGLPKNMFYNTGIATYVFILTNRKPEHRRGKVQLIDASDLYRSMRKNLGNKSHEFTEEHIRQITGTYLDFAENKHSKIFNNSDFGYQKITVERPLRLRTRFTQEKVERLRFIDAIRSEMEWVYDRFGTEVYSNLKPHKAAIEKWLLAAEIKITPKNRKVLLDVSRWQKQKEIMEIAAILSEHFGDSEFDDFNIFSKELKTAIKKLGLQLSAPDKKQIVNCMSWRSEDAARVIKKRDRSGNIHYEPDSELRDTESVPLLEDVDDYFLREVLPHVPDAWIDHKKTVIGYEISFTRCFYTYEPLRPLDEIAKDILILEKETDGILKQVVSFEG